MKEDRLIERLVTVWISLECVFAGMEKNRQPEKTVWWVGAHRKTRATVTSITPASAWRASTNPKKLAVPETHKPYEAAMAMAANHTV